MFLLNVFDISLYQKLKRFSQLYVGSEQSIITDHYIVPLIIFKHFYKYHGVMLILPMYTYLYIMFLIVINRFGFDFCFNYEIRKDIIDYLFKV